MNHEGQGARLAGGGTEAQRPLRLHLGCGARFLPGYVHVDLADHPHIDYQQRVDQLPMFQDDSVETIYASHVLEYFDRLEASGVLREWCRVLKPGGILRLAVPDFEALVAVYAKYGDLSRILGPLYGRWVVPGTGVVIYHRTVYDFASLASTLREAGFGEVARWDWRSVFVGELAGFDDYSQAYVPHMDKAEGILISLNVEARK